MKLVMKKPIISHLEELRSRLLVVLATLAVLFVGGFFASDYLIKFLESTLLAGQNVSLIVTSPLEFIYAKLKLGFLLAVMFAFPLIAYEALMFVKPGMRKKEKRLILFCLPFSIILFLAGIAFCYLILLKVGIWFLAKIALDVGIKNLWSLNRFVTFVFVSCLTLGFVFQMPIILYLFNKFGVISIETLRKKRKYATIIIFIFAAVITPPDILTQLLVAIPMLALYELSIVLVRLLK